MITVQAKIEADKSNVWDGYLQPEHIVNWNFANEDWCCPRAENELKVGGKYLARMEAKDGSFGFDFEAIYSSIDLGNSFSYVMTDNRRVKVVFEEKENGTLITVSFDPENENTLELQRDGWQAILDNFKKYMEKTYPL